MRVGGLDAELLDLELLNLLKEPVTKALGVLGVCNNSHPLGGSLWSNLYLVLFATPIVRLRNSI